MLKCFQKNKLIRCNAVVIRLVLRQPPSSCMHYHHENETVMITVEFLVGRSVGLLYKALSCSQDDKLLSSDCMIVCTIMQSLQLIINLAIFT